MPKIGQRGPVLRDRRITTTADVRALHQRCMDLTMGIVWYVSVAIGSSAVRSTLVVHILAPGNIACSWDCIIISKIRVLTYKTNCKHSIKFRTSLTYYLPAGPMKTRYPPILLKSRERLHTVGTRQIRYTRTGIIEARLGL